MSRAGASLLIDTASGAVSAGLGGAEGALIVERRADGQEPHAETLPVLVQEMLRETATRPGDIFTVLATTGPGRFTAVRAGLAFQTGFAHAGFAPAHRPRLLGVNSFAALALSIAAARGALILVAIPAGRRGLYAALLDRAGRFKDEPRCAPAEAIAQGLAAIKPDQLHLTGPGSQTLIPALEQAGLDARHAAQNAPDMASLARFAVKADASEHPPQPLYVRAPDAEPAAPAPFAL